MKHLRSSGALLAALTLTACTLVDDGIDDRALAKLEVTTQGDRATLAVNETLQLSAVGLDASGMTVPLTDLTWRSSSNVTATVDAFGLVTGRRSNDVTITARAGDLSTTVNLTVAGAMHAGDITKSETWHAWDNPHYVRAPGVFIGGEENPTVTIEAGVEVQFASDALLLVGRDDGRATLRVQGSEDKPVVFTSDAASPEAGDYPGLAFFPAGRGSLEWLTIEYAGAEAGTNYEGCLQLLGAQTQVVLDHVTVRQCASYGVFLGEDAGFGEGSTHLTVEETAKHAVWFHQPATVDTVPPNSTFDANPSAVKVTAGPIETSTTWMDLGVPYDVSEGFVDVAGTSRPVLTIAAGTRLRFGAESGLRAGVTADAGDILAVGTAEAPVVFTSDAEEPAPGDWGGLVFEDAASTGSKLQWAVVEYAGGERGTNYSNAAVSVFTDNKGEFIRNTTIRHSEGFGILRATDLHGNFVTDFTAGALGNVFANNAGGDQSLPE